jgi:hypothetical protein
LRGDVRKRRDQDRGREPGRRRIRFHMNHPHRIDEIKEFRSCDGCSYHHQEATILKESVPMWRRKAVAFGLGCLMAAGCASVREQRRQAAGPQVSRGVDVQLAGCLLAGAAPGTFVLADVSGADRPEGPRRAVDVMSTRVGLTSYVGRRIGVWGVEQVVPKGTIYEVGQVFRIRAIAEVGARCDG